MAEHTGTAPVGGAALSGAGRDVVVLRLPAVGAYLSVLRTATASLASRLDFTIDDIEDLRIAVDEACAMLLAQAVRVPTWSAASSSPPRPSTSRSRC
jgi:serine/threonine-protein kinase RsbW